jgi:peptidyl-prolyl cis-trans isomerase SurA
VTAIDAQSGTASAKVNATGAPFSFKVADQKELQALKVGVAVYANFTTHQVSLNGRDACCTMATTLTAAPSTAVVDSSVSIESLAPAKSAAQVSAATAGGAAATAGGESSKLSLTNAAPAPAAAAPSAAAPDSATSEPFGAGASIPLERVVAVVGDEPILWSTVLERINIGRAQGMEIPNDSAGQMALAVKTTNDLVDEELLVQKAKELKIEVTDDDVAPAVDAQLKNVRDNYPSAVEFRAALKQAGYGNPEEYRKFIIEQQKRVLLQRKVIEELKKDGKLLPVGVTESEVDSAFQRNRARLPKRPATVTFRQLVITPRPSPAAKAAAKAKADSIEAELKRLGPSAEEFASVAKRESMDLSTKEQGGDLGWNHRGNMVPEFDRWMFALPPGTISPVIETVFGYHIIRVDRIKPSEVKASHILIRWKIDSADVAAGRMRADSVLAAWKAGANFDTLVLHQHDPNEEKGSLQPYPRDSLPASYKVAFTGKTAGSFVGPFAIEDRGTGREKFVIAELLTVEESGEYTESDWRDRIRDQLAQEKAIARLLQLLRKDTYVSVRV